MLYIFFVMCISVYRRKYTCCWNSNRFHHQLADHNSHPHTHVAQQWRKRLPAIWFQPEKKIKLRSDLIPATLTFSSQQIHSIRNFVHLYRQKGGCKKRAPSKQHVRPKIYFRLPLSTLHSKQPNKPAQDRYNGMREQMPLQILILLVQEKFAWPHCCIANGFRFHSYSFSFFLFSCLNIAL